MEGEAWDFLVRFVLDFLLYWKVLFALETKEQREMVYSKECVPFPCQTTPRSNNNSNNNSYYLYVLSAYYVLQPVKLSLPLESHENDTNVPIL